MRFIPATILAAACAAALTGCGQKGPLVLPPQQPAPQSKAPLPSPAPEGRPAAPFPDVPATNEKK
jgi:predicted small lipoprotein YifL